MWSIKKGQGDQRGYCHLFHIEGIVYMTSSVTKGQSFNWKNPVTINSNNSIVFKKGLELNVWCIETCTKIDFLTDNNIKLLKI